MSDEAVNKDDFLYRPTTYRGKIDPAALVFNANLQEFARRIGFICDLETSGKLPPGDAYDRIRLLWTQLSQSHHNLGIGQPPSDPDMTTAG